MKGEIICHYQNITLIQLKIFMHFPMAKELNSLTDKLDDKGCNGAPDWIIEIVSPSSQHLDYLTKLLKYRTAGVREYWIVNPLKDTIQTYSFEGEENSVQYAFDESIPVTIYSDFKICIADLLK